MSAPLISSLLVVLLVGAVIVWLAIVAMSAPASTLAGAVRDGRRAVTKEMLDAIQGWDSSTNGRSG